MWEEYRNLVQTSMEEVMKTKAQVEIKPAGDIEDAQIEFREKQGQFLLLRNSLGKGLPDLTLFSVRMARCAYRNV